MGCRVPLGCWSQGAKRERALKNVHDAVRENVSAVAEINTRKRLHLSQDRPVMDGLDGLSERRKLCDVCCRLNPGAIRNGSSFDFDPQVLSYWSQWLGNSRPKLLIVGQDFGSVQYFVRFHGKDDPSSLTNGNLRKLLREAGIDVGEPPAHDPHAPVFLTNSILCLKEGAMAAPIRAPWVRNCSANYLRPLIDFLRPVVTVGMGSNGWMAVRHALNLSDLPRGISEAAGGMWRISPDHAVFAVGHCSGLGLANRSWAQQVLDWREIGQVLAASPPGTGR